MKLQNQDKETLLRKKKWIFKKRVDVKLCGRSYFKYATPQKMDKKINI